MSRVALAALLALLTLLPVAVCAEEPYQPNEIRTDDGARIEILDQPVRVGETIELPEGFIRVEEEGTEDREVGSFAVVPAATLTATARALAASGGVPTPPAPESPRPVAQPSPAGRATFVPIRGDGPCRAERSAYLRQLWRLSGIDVEDPDALLLGLEGAPEGPRAGFYWFALASDPFRPLAWSSDLRDRADALVRCVRESGAR